MSWAASFRVSPQTTAALLLITGISAMHYTKHDKRQAAIVATSAADSPQASLIFMGTGSSTGCPRPLCPLVFPPKENNSQNMIIPTNKTLQAELASYCNVSKLAIQGDPKNNKNYRNNPSLLISFPDKHNNVRNIIIDVGKTFREGALRWLPEHSIASLDAIILTHPHMDAIGGLDDVRGFQKFVSGKAVPMPLYLSRHCLEELQQRFPWLFPSEPSNSNGFQRHVASFDVTLFESLKPVQLFGLDVTPLPVMHGEDMVSYGFEFVLGSTRVVYLSDISRMLPDTMNFINRDVVDILIVDALHPEISIPVHYSLTQAVALARQMNARKVYLVGMNCDSYLPHDEMNRKLLREFPDLQIQLAFDGLRLDCF